MSAVRMPAENVTLLPSGSVMVPPAEPLIGSVTDAIVPATIKLKEADFAASATLVAVTDTVYGVGTEEGAV